MRGFAITAALVLAALPPRAAEAAPLLRDPGFELESSRAWFGPRGGGSGEGSGHGAIVLADGKEQAHSGRRSVRLVVRGSPQAENSGWAFVSQKSYCIPYTKLDASAFVLADPDCVATGATVQLRLEYFEDDLAARQIPIHAAVSEPFVADGSSEGWQELRVTDRVPSQARTVVLSLLLIGHNLSTNDVVVWVDDVTLQSRSARGKAGAAP